MWNHSTRIKTNFSHVHTPNANNFSPFQKFFLFQFLCRYVWSSNLIATCFSIMKTWWFECSKHMTNWWKIYRVHISHSYKHSKHRPLYKDTNSIFVTEQIYTEFFNYHFREYKCLFIYSLLHVFNVEAIHLVYNVYCNFCTI